MRKSKKMSKIGGILGATRNDEEEGDIVEIEITITIEPITILIV